MELEKQKNSLLVFMCIIMMMIVLGGGFYLAYKSFFSKPKEKEKEKEKPKVVEISDYDIKLIKEINKSAKGNYLISPYSIEIALGMLRDGANGNTKKEIENLIGDRKINYLQAKSKINVANAVFVNDKYKDSVLDNYYKIVTDKYNSEIVYDKFEGPDVVNNWVKKETYDMIPKLLNKLDKEDLLVLVNALAMDVEWKYGFDCKKTREQEFTKVDGTKYNVAMMHENFDKELKYFKTNDAKGVIIPYQGYDKNGKKDNDGTTLEFVGIIPDDIEKYMNNLTVEKINDVDNKAVEASEDTNLVLSLPVFKYDYEINDFISNLKNLGIKDVFEEGVADLSKMINVSSHVSAVIHKTHIDLKETGTKAAAATAVIVTKDAAVKDPVEEDNIVTFNKPFVYIIRDKDTKEMLFFGVVYEPNKWNGSTCEK